MLAWFDIDNLLPWNSYIVDFEEWWPPGKRTPKGWYDGLYIEYELARVGKGGNSHDMSTWIL